MRIREVAAQSTSNLQDTFLKHLRDSKAEVTMFLVNGIRLQGQIKRFDNFTVQLVRGNSTQIVYKHAISAILPVDAIHLFDPHGER
jgi:host factor-I protein